MSPCIESEICRDGDTIGLPTLQGTNGRVNNKVRKKQTVSRQCKPNRTKAPFSNAEQHKPTHTNSKDFFEEKNIAKIAWPQNDANAESIINAEIFIKLSVINGKREITVSQVVKTFGLVIIIRNACQKADLND